MSTQTANIGLHQWESTDNFLREDFNEDNRKIDAAIQQATDKSAQAAEQLSTRLDTAIGQISDRLDTEIGQVTAKLNTEIGKLSTALDTEIGQVSDRLEEAVGSATQIVKLYESVSKSTAGEIEVNLSGIDWEKFQRYEIYIRGRASDRECSVALRFNGCSGENDYAVIVDNGVKIYRSCMAYLSLKSDRTEGIHMVLFGGVTGVTGHYLTIGGLDQNSYLVNMMSQTGVMMSTLNTMSLTADSGRYMAAGVTIAIYGVCKIV